MDRLRARHERRGLLFDVIIARSPFNALASLFGGVAVSSCHSRYHNEAPASQSATAWFTLIWPVSLFSARGRCRGIACMAGRRPSVL